jgi:hypothetical protein
MLTVTCNAEWREIRENLFDHQQPCDRPDIVARVFHLKLEAVLDDIIQKQILVRTIAYIHVIELQKPGLPHCYMLITLRGCPQYQLDIQSVVHDHECLLLVTHENNSLDNLITASFQRIGQQVQAWCDNCDQLITTTSIYIMDVPPEHRSDFLFPGRV